MNAGDATRPSESLIVRQFRLAWDDSVPCVSEYVSTQETRQLSVIGALISEDARQRLSRGLSVDPADYFRQFPDCCSNQNAAEKICEQLNEVFADFQNAQWWNSLQADFPHFASQCESRFGVQRIATDTQNPIQSGRIIGDFELISFVGKGTHGQVFLARDTTLDRFVALKVAKSSVNDRNDADASSEGRLLAKLRHPNIVQVYREQTDGDQNLLAMEFVVGQPLSDWIERQRVDQSHGQTNFRQWAAQANVPDTLDQFVDQPIVPHKTNCIVAMVALVRDVAQALGHAHGRGVLHHDVKPANILIDLHGTPKLADFNVASSGDQSFSKTPGGTINYMAPEHLKAIAVDLGGSMDNVDIRSDLYSLGIVLLELLTGQKHWYNVQQGNEQTVFNQLLAERIKAPPTSELGNVDSALLAIVQKSLAPNPDDRYQTAAEFSTDLDGWIQGHPNTFAAPGRPKDRALRWFKRNRTIVASIAVAFLLITAITGFLVRGEQTHLALCEKLASDSTAELLSGNDSGAAELLGRAKARMSQLTLTPYLSPTRYAEASQEIKNTSRQLSNYDLQRFTARFGEAALSSIHQSGRTDGEDLIANALQLYGVLQRSDWQNRAPFVSLPNEQKRQVAENVTELLLVSALNGKESITAEKLQTLKARFPAEHKNLPIVREIEHVVSDDFKGIDISTTADSYDAYINGVLASVQQDDKQAYDWFDKSIQLRKPGTPVRFWAHYWQGVTCERLELYDEAMVRYGTCLGLRPDFAWPSFNMGLLCATDGKPEMALRFLQNAIQIEPDFTAAYVALGAIQDQQDNRSSALATYDNALTRGLQSAELYHNRALLLLKENRRQEAIADLTRAVDLGIKGNAKTLLQRLTE